MTNFGIRTHDYHSCKCSKNVCDLVEKSLVNEKSQWPKIYLYQLNTACYDEYGKDDVLCSKNSVKFRSNLNF